MDSPMGSVAGSTSSFLSTAPTLVDALESTFVDYRDALLDDGIVISPLGILKNLAAEHGNRVDEKTFEIHLTGQTGPEAVRYRVILTVGFFNGHGEAPRLRLALQLAAGDLLETMREQGHDIPNYGLLPGCRVNPMIYKDLKELCEIEGLCDPVYNQVSPQVAGIQNNYAFKCTVGGASTIGGSDSIFLAKRLSAKIMYETLAGELYPDDRIATGAGCIQIDDLHKMGINPVISLRAQQRQREEEAKIDEPDETPIPRRPRGPQETDIYDDDYAENDDAVVIIGRQLTSMELTEYTN